MYPVRLDGAPTLKVLISCCMSLSDVQQTLIGSCKMEDIAVKVATRVKGHFPERNQLLVDAGFVAMSYDGFAAYDKQLDGSYCVVEKEPNLRWADTRGHTGLRGVTRGIGG